MKKLKRILLISLVLFVVLPVGGVIVMNLFSKPPTNLGVTNGRLSDCPSSPNCVCTQATSDSHRMAAISFEGRGDDVRERLKSAIGSMARSKITEETDNYLRAEFTTAIMRFVDDVELLIDLEARVIHFRSASRIGHSDLGANRKRMEELIKRFEAQGQMSEAVVL